MFFDSVFYCQCVFEYDITTLESPTYCEHSGYTPAVFRCYTKIAKWQNIYKMAKGKNNDQE